ncbi:hypothetical protein BCR44DRAFT_42058 [Catenaria anguillulae PL171]|uniref:Uncharacterized protein n=1 Tax=Catenaria anguillulae PL171 TaxID=765915 RepID=A0A1Y2HYH0_9FUNG|nr:hypothetical protein BCR44DRAFT_42058 [Catenaria anguillulae PL171]
MSASPSIPDLVAALTPLLDHLGHLFAEVGQSQSDLEHELEHVLAEVQLLQSILEANSSATSTQVDVTQVVQSKHALVVGKLDQTAATLQRVRAKVEAIARFKALQSSASAGQATASP